MFWGCTFCFQLIWLHWVLVGAPRLFAMVLRLSCPVACGIMVFQPGTETHFPSIARWIFNHQGSPGAVAFENKGLCCPGRQGAKLAFVPWIPLEEHCTLHHSTRTNLPHNTARGEKKLQTPLNLHTATPREVCVSKSLQSCCRHKVQ